MSLKIYHQVGHRPNWSIDCFETERCGDGLILSPVHQSRDQVEAMDAAIRRRALFDPQYYLPNSPKPRLASYPFFPEQISSGFSTVDFPLVALESAQRCVAFQLDREFEGVVIPARFVDQMTSKYFESQEEYTVLPFLKAISSAGADKPVHLTIPITSAMLVDAGFRTNLLNWITGFSEISGVYVLVNDERATKQILSAEVLFAYLQFAHELGASGLKVILGHLNTESVLFSMLEDVTLTFGAYENTRMFSLDKFVESDEERRAPKARIYLPALLNWIQYEQAMQIRRDAPDLWSQIYAPTAHSERVLEAAAFPHFSQPDLYRHHFTAMSAQIAALAPLPVLGRCHLLSAQIRNAMAFHRQIIEMPLQLDRHGAGAHLQAWLDTLNRYQEYLAA